MRNIFIYLTVILLPFLWSCGDDNGVNNSDDPENPKEPGNTTLEISVTDLTFEAKGGQKEFTISCNSNWTITNNSTWCRTDLSNGNGDRTITVIATPYSETEDQNTNLTIKAGDKTKVLTVTQKHGDAIILTKDKFDVSQEGEDITIEVKSNIEYQVSIPSQFQSWIKQVTKTKALQTKTFNINISSNESFNKREGYVVIAGNSSKDTVYIYQAQKNQLILTENTYNILAEEKDISVELRTNVDYEVIIPSDVTSWIRQIETRAIRTDHLKFHVEANSGSKERFAQIVIKDKNSDSSDTLFVIQKMKDTYVGNITLSTVEELIALRNTGYKKINGNLTISGNTLTTLQLLENILEEIEGDLIIDCGSLIILDGLCNLKTIKGSLIVKKFEGENFKGLTKLEFIEKSFEINPSSEISLKTLHSFEGLENLVSIGEDFRINSNNSLNSLISFKGLSRLNSIGENFEISSFSQSSSISPTMSSHFSSLKSLQSFEGLENLTMIGKDFKIKSSAKFYPNTNNWAMGDSYSLNSLSSFKGLSKLNSIGGSFDISSFANSFNSSSLSSLTSFEGLENLIRIGENFKINSYSDNNSSSDSYSLNSLTSFKGLCKLNSIGGSFEIISSDASSSYSLSSLSSFEGLENLTTIGEDFRIKSSASSSGSHSLNSLSSFKGLNNLNSINGSFEILLYDSNSLNQLSSFEGLENLSVINKTFKIESSYSLGLLASFKGLGRLNTIGYNFEIISSNSLNSLRSFEGLENLSSIGNDFRITSSDNSLKVLSSFKGLNNLSLIGNNFEILSKTSRGGSLNELSSFDGLENLTKIGRDFRMDAYSYSSSSSSSSSLNSLSSFKGLNNLNSIGGNFEINSYSSYRYSASLNQLSSFEGLDNLSVIGKDFKLTSVSFVESGSAFNSLRSLVSYNGLSKLGSIGGSFISQNRHLSTEGLKLLTSIGDSFLIKVSDVNLDNFLQLESIGKELMISGENLNDLNGLINLKRVGDITFKECPKLHDFCVLKPLLVNHTNIFYTTNCGYNPTKTQILNGRCSQ